MPKKNVLVFYMFVFLALQAQGSPQAIRALEVSRYILSETDSSFGGVFLDQDRLAGAGLTRLEAQNLQFTLRRRLEFLSGGLTLDIQRPFLDEASIFAKTVCAETPGDLPLPIMPTLGPHDFVVAMDIDETVARQWHDDSMVGHSSIKSLELNIPDTNLVKEQDIGRDRFAASDDPVLVRLSSTVILLRPSFLELTRELTAIPGFKGFVFFTAKEDAAAAKFVAELKRAEPEIGAVVLGVLSRGHLSMDALSGKGLKDLRSIDPSLEKVLLIDDNDRRVLQRERLVIVPAFDEWAVANAARDGSAFERGLQLEALRIVGHYIRKTISRYPERTGDVLRAIARNLGGERRFMELLTAYVAVHYGDVGLEVPADFEIRLKFAPVWKAQRSVRAYRSQVLSTISGRTPEWVRPPVVEEAPEAPQTQTCQKVKKSWLERLWFQVSLPFGSDD